MKGPGCTPTQAGTLVYLGVASIEEALKRAEEKGGKTLMPKTSIGQWGFIAQLTDSEGNRVALHAMV